MKRSACVLAVAALLFLSGCLSVRYGSPPPVERLGRLSIGISTQSDILLALGEPRGQGMLAHSGLSGPPRTIWFYEYTLAGGSHVDLSILLVFVKRGRYDGHLWFSSVQLLERQE